MKDHLHLGEPRHDVQNLGRKEDLLSNSSSNWSMDNWNLSLAWEWLALRGLRFRIWAWAWAWASDCAADAIAGLADCRDTRQSVRACLRMIRYSVSDSLDPPSTSWMERCSWRICTHFDNLSTERSKRVEYSHGAGDCAPCSSYNVSFEMPVVWHHLITFSAFSIKAVCAVSEKMFGSIMNTTARCLGIRVRGAWSGLGVAEESCFQNKRAFVDKT